MTDEQQISPLDEDGDAEQAPTATDVQRKKALQKMLILGGLFLVVTGAAVFFYTWPKYSESRAATDALFAKQEEQTTKMEKLQKLLIENKKPPVLSPEAQAALKKLPDEADVPDLIRELDEITYLSDSSDVDDADLRSFSISEPSTTGAFKTISINGSFSSARYSLFDLLRRFEKTTERIFNVSQVSVGFSEHDTQDTTPLFGNQTTDTRYRILLAKRQSFLLSDDEQDELHDMQVILESEYKSLQRKRDRTESENERLSRLEGELDALQSEAQYTLVIVTYLDSAPAPAPAAVPDGATAPAGTPSQ